MPIKLRVGRELPPVELFWESRPGVPRDLSSGYTFAVTIRQAATETVLVGATITANPAPTLEHADPRLATLEVTPVLGGYDALRPKVPSSILVTATRASDSLKLEQEWPIEVTT